jgi:trans-aconitate methyltransferase
MNDYAGKKILDLFSRFALNRNNFIASLIRRHIRDEVSQEILEFGAGKGEFIDRFSSMKNVHTHAVETDEEYFKILSGKHSVYRTMQEAPSNLDLIFAIDALEHVEDDQALLKAFYDKLKEGPTLFIYVPARQELFSEYDKSIGHFRRYGKAELKKKVSNAGFVVERIQYHELPGYFATALHNKFLRIGIPSENSLKVYDKILPYSNYMEGILSPPIGKSLYLSAKRTSLK